MKASEVREMSTEELHQKISESTEELFNLRFQHGTDQLENPMRLQQVKRDIARIKTILRERGLTSGVS
jgi:large subunit ribosomal protein L29